jgi:hypothetical protein
MADPTLLDRETILRAVRTWPPDEQRALAGEILRHAGVPPVEEPLVPPTPPGSPASWPRGRHRRPTTRWRAGSMSATWSAMAASAQGRPARPLCV